MTETNRGDGTPDAAGPSAGAGEPGRPEATEPGPADRVDAPVGALAHSTDSAGAAAHGAAAGADGTAADGATARPDRPTGPGWPPTPAGTRGGAAPGGPTLPPDEPTYATGGLRLAVLAGLVVLMGFRFGWPLLAMIGGLVVMIFLHELGHFVTAKWSGMKVTEFFIGFGPRIWSFRRGETEYGLKVVPAGAYVRIVGMNNLDDADPDDEPRTYRQQSFPKRLLVVSAGSIMHFVQAFVLLVIALGIVGVPGGSVMNPDQDDPVAWAVTTVSDGSAADDAGLTDDDRIVAVAGRPTSDFDDGLAEAIAGYDVGDEVALTVERDGAERQVRAELGPRPAGEGGEEGSPFLGVGWAPRYDDAPIGLGQAVLQAPGEMVRFTGESLGALAGFFSPDGLGDFADNVGEANRSSGGGQGSAQAPAEDGDENRMLSIYGVVRLGADMGAAGGAVVLLLLFFQINVFIGIFNMVPLPPLDGGHAAVAIYERFRSRRGLRYHADVAKLLPLTYAVVMALVLLGVTSLYLDIVNPIDT